MIVNFNSHVIGFHLSNIGFGIVRDCHIVLGVCRDDKVIYDVRVIDGSVVIVVVDGGKVGLWEG